MSKAPAVLLALALTAAGGCAGLWRTTEPPRVSLVDVRPLAMTLFEQRYGLKLRVQNPNPTPLSVDGMSFDVELNERAFATGVSPRGFSVPAYGETVVDVEVVSNLARLYEQLRALESGHGEALRYRLSGDLHLTGPAESLRFEQDGALRL
jgi:LEA14-like dessication related protein